MDESLQITAAEGGAGSIILRLKGRLDGHGSPILVERCSTALKVGVHVILNLHDLTFVSSSGIGAFLALSEDFRDRGTSLRLACTTQTVRLAIALLNLEDFLLMHETEESAIQALAATKVA